MLAWAILCAPAPAEEPPPFKPVYVSSLFELQLDPPEWKKRFEIPEFRVCGSLRMDPAGDSVLFDGYKAQDGATMTDSRLLHYSLDGALRRELGPGTMPTRSPDGKHVAFSAYHDRGVWVMDADGANPRKLDPEGWGIQWSPVSATQLAYTRRGMLVAHDLETGVTRDLFPGGESPFQYIHYNFAWSPDGRQIAFLGQRAGAERTLAIVESQGAEFGFRTHLQSRASAALSWHPDGRRVMFPLKSSVGWFEINQFDLTAPDAQPTVIPGQPTDRNRISVCCHPDGQRLFVLSYEMKHPVTGEPYTPPP